MSDPNFNEGESLTRFTHNLLGGKGINDFFFGTEGLLDSSLAGKVEKVMEYGTREVGGMAGGPIGGLLGLGPQQPSPEYWNRNTNVGDASTEPRNVPLWMTNVSRANTDQASIFKDASTPMGGGASGIPNEGNDLTNPIDLTQIDSFDGLLNVNPETAEGKQRLMLFSEQMRALTGFEGTVKEQVSLNQQLQNFQNFGGDKIQNR
jgi:hypothetical protein